MKFDSNTSGIGNNKSLLNILESNARHITRMEKERRLFTLYYSLQYMNSQGRIYLTINCVVHYHKLE